MNLRLMGCALVLAGCDAASIGAGDDTAAATSRRLGAMQLHLQAIDGPYVAAEEGGGGDVNANRPAGGPWETFDVRDLNGGALESGDAVELRTVDGQHALTVETGTLRVTARAGAGAGATFALERLAGPGPIASGEQVALRAGALYVAAEGGGGGVLHANRTAVGPWESFRITLGATPPGPIHPPSSPVSVDVSLKSHAGLYVVAEQGGGAAVNANRTGAGPWETFTLVDLNGGALQHGDTVRLRTIDGVHYLSAPGDGRLVTSTAQGPNEELVLERAAGAGRVVNGERIGLRAFDGRWVVAEGGGGAEVKADRPGMGPWEEFTLEAHGGLPSPSRLVGRLRIDALSFVDDTGPVLPVFCHFGEAFSRYTRDPNAVRRQLDVIASAGYDGIRFWTTLGGAYWAGREVSEQVTPNYWGQLEAFMNELKSRGLRGVISQGDIARITDRPGFASRLSDVLDRVGTAESVAIIEGGNEAWQTGEPDPQRLAQFVGAIESRHPQVLYTLTSPPSELAVDLDAYSIGPADLFDVHGSRDGHWWDKTRHIFSITYEGKPKKRLGWQGEPAGPGAAVSVTEFKHELDSDTLAAMAAMSLMSRQAWCFMSGPGVLFDSPLEDQPGFWSVPRVRDALPRDVMRFDRLHHGGSTWASERVFAPNGETRCDHASNGDGRFVAIIYGPTLDYSQVRSATIEKVTDLGNKARVVVGRK